MDSMKACSQAIGKSGIGLIATCLLLLSSGNLLRAQNFRIADISIDALNRVHLHHEADTNSYYILLQGETVTNIAVAVDIALGIPNTGELLAPASSTGARFYLIRRVSIAQPLDTDGDGIDDVYELRHRNFLNPLNPADALADFDKDGVSNLQEYRAGTDPAAGLPPLTLISSSSPANGEGGVAVTRETI